MTITTNNRGEGEKGRRGDREINTHLLYFPFSIFRFPLFLPMFLSIVLCAACQPNAEIMNSGHSTPSAAASPANSNGSFDSFEKDLETMRTADFDYVYVFRRQDGAPLTGPDKKFLRANSPPATNRFLLSDNERAVIAGSKFKFSPENLEALRSYFNLEDFSKPDNKTAPAVNSNMKSEANSQ